VSDGAAEDLLPGAVPAPPPPPPLPVPERDPASRRRLVGDVLVAFFLAVLPDLVRAVWSLSAYGPSSLPLEPWDAADLAARSLQIALPLLWLQVRCGEPLWNLGLRRTGAGVVLFGGFLLAALAWGLDLALHAWFRAEPLPSEPPVAAPRGLWLVGLTAAHLANAFGEEVAVRAFLFDRIERLTGSAGLAILASNVLVASYHLYQGPGPALHALAFGLVFGVVFAWSRLLWPLVIAHALVNLIPHVLPP
jgi:membrane protease YdiL (CAAX protease family)